MFIVFFLSYVRPKSYVRLVNEFFKTMFLNDWLVYIIMVIFLHTLLQGTGEEITVESTAETLMSNVEMGKTMMFMTVSSQIYVQSPRIGKWKCDIAVLY